MIYPGSQRYLKSKAIYAIYQLKSKMKYQSRRGFAGAMLAPSRLVGFMLLLGTFALAGVSTLVAQQPSDRFSDLEDHIRRTDRMTVSELQNWATAFASEAGSLGNRLGDFVAAVELIELYEDVDGPLFTSAGQSSFKQLVGGRNKYAACHWASGAGCLSGGLRRIRQ